ncbi:MAG: sialidase family protein [Candidatus Nanopelagicales bacterium]
MKKTLAIALAAMLTAMVAPGTAQAADPPIGTAWAGVQESGNKRILSVATNGTGTWVAITLAGAPGTPQRSTDNGVTWTTAATPPPVVEPQTTGNAFNDVAWCNDRFVAVGKAFTETSDVTVTAWSTDGNTWTTVLPTGNASGVSPQDIACNGNNAVAVGGALEGGDYTVLTSSNAGLSWAGRTDFTGSQGYDWRGVTYRSGVGFVAVRGGTGTNDVMISTDNGANWTGDDSAVNATWSTVTNDGTTIVAVADGSPTDNRVMTSTDGIAWTARTAAANISWNDIAAGGGTFVAVASGANADTQIMTSTDSGATWTSRTAAAKNNWNAVGYGGSPSRFVAGGNTFNSIPANVNYMYTTPTPTAPQSPSVVDETLSWTTPIWTATSGLTTYTVVYKKTVDAGNPAVPWGVYAQRTTAWPGGTLPLQVELNATPGSCGITNTTAGWTNCPMPRGALLPDTSYTFRVFARSATNLGTMSSPITYTIIA